MKYKIIEYSKGRFYVLDESDMYELKPFKYTYNSFKLVILKIQIDFNFENFQ